MPWWKFAIKLATALALGFVSLVTGAEFWSAVTEPTAYPFGSEGPAAAMWTYGSREHYLIGCGSAFGASLLAQVALWVTARPALRLVCSLPFPLVWLWLIFDGARLS